MTLTAAGRLLHHKAAQILRDLELARQEVMAEGSQLAGEVVIGATPSVIAMAGAALLGRCREQVPRVRLRFLEGYSAYLQNWVTTGAVDLALVNGLPIDSPRLARRCLAVERLFAIAAPDGLALPEDGIPLAALLRMPLLLPSAANPLRAQLDQAARGIGGTATVLHEIDSVGLLKDLARQGMAAAVLPFGAVRQDVAAGSLRAAPIIEPEIRSELHLLHLVDQPPTRVATRVVDLLVEVLADIVAGPAAHGFVELRPPR